MSLGLRLQSRINVFFPLLVSTCVWSVCGALQSKAREEIAAHKQVLPKRSCILCFYMEEAYVDYIFMWNLFHIR